MKEATYTISRALMRIAALAMALCLAMSCAAQSSLKTYSDKVANGYNFWLYSPDKRQGKSEKIPVIVFLHGASLCGTNLNKVLKYGPLDAIKRGLNIKAYIVAPQTRSSWQPQRVMNVVDYVLEHHPDADPDRIYVAGMSLGGYGSIDFAAAYPDRVAAALSFCGGGTYPDLGRLNELPLWIIHGKADRAISIRESDRVVEAMRKADPETPRLRYDRVDGMNHGQPARYFYMPDFYRWLFRHSLKDKGRPIAEGFDVSLNSTHGAYRSLRRQNDLIEVPGPNLRDPYTLHEGMFEIEDFYDIEAPDGIESEIEFEELPIPVGR